MNLRNPAALGAALKGDLLNAVIAGTPGGIEAQEAAGQKMFCIAETLPLEMRNGAREKLEAIGVIFGKLIDELFIEATLPPGWNKLPTNHSMWSDLLDDKARVRAKIFYKAAFYDRRAFLDMTCRYTISAYVEIPRKGDEKEVYAVCVMDSGKELRRFGEYVTHDFKACEVLEKQAQEWLAETYPNRRDPMAYWD